MEDSDQVEGEFKRPHWIIGAALFFASACVYIVFRSGAYNGDMVWQSCMAEGTVTVRFPPDHLFYGVMVRGIWRAWQAVGLPGRAHIALQTVNGVFGGIMVVTMFGLVLRITARRMLALFVAVFFALTPYVWHHATDVETYGVSKMFQLVAVYFTFLLAEGGAAKRRYWLAFAVAVFHAGAALMQYLHVLLVPAVLVAAFVPRDGTTLAVRVKTALVYLVTVGALVWGPFLYVAFAAKGVSSVSELMAWLLTPNYGWPAFARMGWMKTPLKFVSSFASWPTPFGLPGHEAKRVILGHIPFGTYLSRHWWRIPIVSALALLQLALVTRFVVWRKSIWSRWRSQIVVALVMMLAYQVFGLYWGGGFVSHATAGYMCLLTMAYVVIRETPCEGRFSRILATATPWMCALCAVAAFMFSYVPEHDEKNNLHLQEALNVATKVTAEDLVVSPGGCLTSEYWWYFAPELRLFRLTAHRGPRVAKGPAAHMLAASDAAITETLRAGGRVFVHRLFSEDEDEVTRPWNEFLFAGIRRKEVVGHFKRYPHLKAFESHGHLYWRITALPNVNEGSSAEKQGAEARQVPR